MTRATIASTALLFLIAASAPLLDDPILGFTAEHSITQHALEADFDGMLDATNLESWMKRLTSKPQHVGSPHDKENAEWVASLFRSWGYETEIEVYQVLFPTPIERSVTLVSPERFELTLDEPVLPEDASSAVRQNMLPPYNAYSADGDVEAELVYVNYGIPSDYEELESRGISVEGKIVLARYGGSWRGIKPKVAYEHGAVGCILFSDPLDDGYWRGDVYPDGPFRMGMGAQRGSVADMPLYPGDPLTPGVAATENAERYSIEESPTIMKIPVLPISYDDALPLLRAIDGPVAPNAWKGALPLTYHIGPGPARVHLKLRFNWDLAPAYNVIARLPGTDFPDEWVIRGNHRDGWVFGAGDPTSGQVAMLEEARAIGALAKAGHRPRRTVIFASWDAEEPGLLGSTEWVEDHADDLDQHAVAYINTDGSGRGFIGMGGSHTLEPFINQIAADVTDPQTGVSVLERRRARDRANGSTDTPKTGDLPISPLGSGSDYTPFLQHAGIASLNLGFGGENAGGSYHSAYDSFEHFTRFGDPGFAYGVTLAKVTGRATMRLANADVLPFRFEAFAGHVADYVDELEKLADDLREDTDRFNALVESGSFELAADPTEPFVVPEKKDPVPFLSMAPVRNALKRLQEAAASADKSVAAQLMTGGDAAFNEMLYGVERAMTSDEGLPRRPWFRHQVYAPGFYTGYGVKTLPGIREAVEERKWDEAEREIHRVAEMLGRVADKLEAIAKP